MIMANRERKRKIAGGQAITKALDVLAAFSLETPELSVPELSRKLGLPKSTAYRIVAVLVSRDFLTMDERTKRCRPGPMLARIAGVYLSRFDIRRIASPYLDDLARRYGQTVLLGIRERNTLLYVDKRESSRSLRVSSEVLRPQLLTHGGLGRVVLAQLDSEEREQTVRSAGLKQVGPKSITVPEKFLETVEQAARDGYYLEIEEVTEGVYSVSSPITGRANDLLGVIGVIGPMVHLEEDLAEGLISDVKHAAAEISEQLG